MTPRLLISIVLVVGITPVGLTAQNRTSIPSLPMSERQETKDRDRERSKKASHPHEIRKAIEQLKQAVNGHSAVANQCMVQGRKVEVEESSEVVETSSCDITVTTAKKSKSGARDIRFTIWASLSDLTVPASVEPLNLAGCQPEHGPVIQVVSRTQPGKIVRTTRSPQGTRVADHSDEETMALNRKNLTFFFPNTELAKKAAVALDRAVAVCGGEEWPDEDDLP